MADSTPVLDSRTAATVAAALADLAPAYVPEISNAPGGPGWALLQILGRYTQAIVERLNQAPDKNKLAFLDRMGISLLPPQAARAPVVFQSIPNAGDGSVPAQTRVGAAGPDPSTPIVFETTQAIALAAAKLAGVYVVYPDLDSYADYSAKATAGREFTLFESLKPIRHEMYFAHDTLLRLAGQSTVSVLFDLKTDGTQPLDILWAFWNGEIWEEFTTSDTTAGLTRSGRVHLSTDCGDAQTTVVNGIQGYWVRGIVQSPLAPGPGTTVAAANRIQLKSTISRPLPAGGGGLIPDAAITDGVKLDVTKTFFPLGRTPDANSAFYFTNDEVFSKPGASVELSLTPQLTPQEQADRLAELHLAAQALALEIKIATQAGQGALDAAQALVTVVTAWNDSSLTPALLLLNSQIGLLSLALQNVTDLGGLTLLRNQVDAVLPAMVPIGNAQYLLPVPLVGSYGSCAGQFAAVIESLGSLASLITTDETGPLVNASREASLMLARLGQFAVQGNSDDQLTAFLKAYGELQDVSDIGNLVQPAKDIATDISTIVTGKPGVAWQTLFSLLAQAVTRAGLVIGEAGVLAAKPGNGTTDTGAPALDPARLVWEYWNGDAWATLIQPSANATANFTGAGTLKFTVPHRFGHSVFNGTAARWIRVRLASGSFNTLRYVTWKDQVTNSISSMALIQPRPPCIGGFYLGYDYMSPVVSAEHCIALNDFEWDSYTSAAKWGGSPFEILRPTADRMPSFYLGFDRALPAGVIGLYLHLVMNPSTPTGPDLDWQYWDGSQWQNLGAQDETRGLALPGMVSVAWPGAPSVARARFGTALTWIRGSLKTDTAPITTRLRGAYLNAVWAQNLQTVQNETLGSSNGQPNQSFFVRQTPVLENALVEVRELDGSRAATELPMFTAGLLAAGLNSSDIRTVNDVITGAVKEVWVRWSMQPNLLLSGGGARDYTIERDTGRLVFGDNEQGMIPPAGQDNVLALQYTFGGGTAGNVSAGAITQLLSGVTAQGVSNPVPGEGGSAGESIGDVLTRGPRIMRHRYRAVSREDYEDLAREASPGIAAARAFPARQPNGRSAPGWVTVVIVPQSNDARPQPSFELCRLVQNYLGERAPASIAGLAVIGPNYLAVGVDVSFAPTSLEAAAPAIAGIRAALAAFLQPLTGGPGGMGWPFGRGVYVSDLASVVGTVPGVDYVTTLQLLLNGTPVGDFAAVPDDQIVVAGPLSIILQAAGN